MVDYEFYSSVYHGGAIPADDWAELEARAADQLRRYKRIYTVTAPDEQAEGMAVCAMPPLAPCLRPMAARPQLR